MVKILWFHWPTYRASTGSFLSKFFIYSFGCVRVLVAAHRIFNCVIFSLWRISVVALRHVGTSSLTRDRTHVLCIARQILNHWITREVPTGNFIVILKPLGGDYT